MLMSLCVSAILDTLNGKVHVTCSELTCELSSLLWTAVRKRSFSFIGLKTPEAMPPTENEVTGWLGFRGSGNVRLVQSGVGFCRTDS